MALRTQQECGHKWSHHIDGECLSCKYEKQLKIADDAVDVFIRDINEMRAELDKLRALNAQSFLPE